MSYGLEASRRRERRNVVLTAAIGGLGGLQFGYDTGVIAGALLFTSDLAAPLPRPGAARLPLCV